jgi:hypothetical protein
MRTGTFFVLLISLSLVLAVNWTITPTVLLHPEGDSGNTDYDFTITRNDATDPADIGVTTINMTASITDLTILNNFTVSFAAGEFSRNVTVSITGDTIYETNETFSITLFVGASDTYTPLTVIIINDDSVPIVTIAAAPTKEGNLTFNGTSFVQALTPVTLQFTLNKQTEVGCTFNWATQAGTALTGIDFVPKVSSTQFAPFVGVQTGSVIILGDISKENTEAFLIVNAGSIGCTVTVPGQVAIIDDDPFPFINITTATAVMEGTTGTVSYLYWPMTIYPVAAGIQITVNVALNSTFSTATLGSDFLLPTGGSVLIPAGASVSNMWVRVIGEQLFEANETVTLDFVSVVNATWTGVPTFGGTIINDDPAPALAVTDVAYVEGNTNASRAVIITTGAGWTPTPIQVYWTLIDGTATDGEDYINQTGTAVVGGANGTALITTIIGDTIPESANETFYFVITGSNCVGCTIVKPQGAVTIIDDDEPYVFITGTTATEGATAYVTFTVSIQVAQASDITFDYAVTGGTATAGADFTATSGTGAIITGSKSFMVNVTLLDDTVSEPTESIVLTITNLSGPARNATNYGFAYILDNPSDPIPTVYVYNITVIEGDNGTTLGYVPLTLSFASQRIVNVTYSTRDESAYTPVDYLATDGWVAFAPGQTSQNITVYIVGDTTEELETAFVVRLASVTNANFGNYTAGVIISDDDYLITAAVQSDVYEGSPAFNPRFIGLIIVIGVVVIAIIASIVGFFALKRYVS